MTFRHLLVPFAGALAVLPGVLAGSPPRITVVGPDGLPLHGVGVSCVRGASGMGLTDDEGAAVLPEGCLEAACLRGGFLEGRVKVGTQDGICRLGAAAVLRGTVVGAASGSYVAMLRTAGHRFVQSVPVSEEPVPGPPAFRLEAPPGSYVVEIARFEDEWICSLDAGVLSTGERRIEVAWREPAVVAGLVRDTEGRPFPGVLLHVAYPSEGAAEAGLRCEVDRQALDVVSDERGAFRALVDPVRAYRIVADDAWQPATIEIQGGSPGPVR